MPTLDQYPQIAASDQFTFATGFRVDPQSGKLTTIKIPVPFLYGSKWSMGAGAPTGPGTSGDMYLNVTTGDVWQFTTGWGLTGTNLRGPQGLQGTKLIAGTTDPTGATGADGDSYLNVTSMTMFSPKAAGVWPTGTKLSSGVYDVGAYVEGMVTPSEVVWKFVSPRAWTLPSGSPGYVKAGVAAAAATTFVLSKNGTQIGTLSFAAAAVIGTVTITTSTAIAAGDVLTLTAPASPDTALQDMAFTLAGTRP
jgi:hypothetical protein